MPHFRLVCFRGRGFEAPAILLREWGDLADMIVFLDGIAADGSATAVMTPFYSVPRGIMEGTEPHPSWYPVGAESEERRV